jgi:hypothetical protein
VKESYRSTAIPLNRAISVRIIDVKKSEQKGTVTISFGFNARNQLFDETDPRPLPDTELTEEAEDTIFGYADEFVPKKPLEIFIDLPKGGLPSDTVSLIPLAIQRHFTRRVPDLEHDLKLTRREGIYSLILMILTMTAGILFVILGLSTFFALQEVFAETGSIPPATSFILFIAFILLISNWVTFWATIELFIYDYRTLRRKIHIYKKITRIPIFVKGYAHEPSAG